MTSVNSKIQRLTAFLLFVFLIAGCDSANKQELETENSENTTTPIEETGTVSVVFDFTVDPKAVVTISGSEYMPNELEQELTLTTGSHTIALKQIGLDLEPREFQVEAGKRKIVHVYDPERRAAEWTIQIGGNVKIQADGVQHNVDNLEDLPSSPFQVVAVSTGPKPNDIYNEEGLLNLQGLKHLVTLELQCSPITEAGFEPIIDLLPRLKTFYGYNITDTILKHFERSTSLGYLFASGPMVTDAGLEHLRQVTNLNTLRLQGTSISDAGLQHLEGLKKLGSFELSISKISGTGLKYLWGHQELRSLEFYRTSSLTDSGLEAIAGFPKLKRLSLNNCQGFTDAGLKHLTSLKELTHVNLTGVTTVTDAGVDELRTALPNCKITR